MRWIAEQAREKAGELPHSRRHIVILAGMIGNYLATPEAHSAELKPISDSVLATIGGLRRPTMLVFELRRLPTLITQRRLGHPADDVTATVNSQQWTFSDRVSPQVKQEGGR